ncbi:hypothetical protein [Amycolatopsis pigmentata]|uniref:Uncharacterized protein n=1 Tax=Amycolatopsis pigmentata TaxID=450801 RepID=A0ABW5FZZ6_9PSEU
MTGLVDELGVQEPESLAEQLVTLADGAASRAMVLNDPDYGHHARTAAETLLDHAPRRPDALGIPDADRPPGSRP